MLVCICNAKDLIDLTNSMWHTYANNNDDDDDDEAYNVAKQVTK